MKATEIYSYLNKLGLADQVHLRKDNQIVFYHWNQIMSDLIPSLTVANGRIEKMYYGRTFIPKMYAFTNVEIENDFTDEQYIRNYNE